MNDRIPPPGLQRRRESPPGGEFGYLTASDGVELRVAKWPAPGASTEGSVVLLTGRREFIEKYYETIADLLDRGFAVHAMDWRGQGLSERALENRHKGHVRDFQDYIDDLDKFISDIVLPGARRPLTLMAHSMGGHCALRYLHDHPGIFDRAVLVAPMVDIHWAGGLLKPIAVIASRVGPKHSYALAQHDYDRRDRVFDRNPLTSDPERFADEAALVAREPLLALGGITFGWLSAAMASIKILRAPGYAAAIKTPTLLAGAGGDTVVSIAAQKALARILPDCHHVTIDGARHEILKERDAMRQCFWAAFDDFMGFETSP